MNYKLEPHLIRSNRKWVRLTRSALTWHVILFISIAIRSLWGISKPNGERRSYFSTISIVQWPFWNPNHVRSIGAESKRDFHETIKWITKGILSRLYRHVNSECHRLQLQWEGLTHTKHLSRSSIHSIVKIARPCTDYATFVESTICDSIPFFFCFVVGSQSHHQIFTSCILRWWRMRSQYNIHKMSATAMKFAQTGLSGDTHTYSHTGTEMRMAHCWIQCPWEWAAAMRQSTSMRTHCLSDKIARKR